MVDRFKHFIDRANEHHNGKYSYEKFNYIDAKTSSIIICPLHGEFKQNPDHHVRAGAYGCPTCANIQRKINRSKASKRQTEYPHKPASEFLSVAQAKFGDKFEYDLTNYTGSTGGKISIRCPEHGWFEKVPRVFIISGCGCTQCGLDQKNQSKTKPYDNFLEDAKLIHGDSYVYPESNRDVYRNRKSKVKIICNKHGEFTKSAQKHLSGQGCFRCGVEALVADGSLPGGYNKSLFENNADISNRNASLYYLSINNGEMYKIGISQNLTRRIDGIKCKSAGYIKSVELILKEDTYLYDAYRREQDILKQFEKYRTQTSFSTELFSVDISKNSKFKNIFYGSNNN